MTLLNIYQTILLYLPAGTQIITREGVDDAIATFGRYKWHVTEIIFSESETEIGEYVFKAGEARTNATHLVLPYGITQIGQEACWSSMSLSSIVIPESVREIGAWAFTDCSKLTNIKLPGS